MTHAPSAAPRIVALFVGIALAVAVPPACAQGTGTDRLTRATNAALVDSLVEAATLTIGGFRAPLNPTSLTLDGGGQNFREDGYANHWWDFVTPTASFFENLIEPSLPPGPTPTGVDIVRMANISFWQFVPPATADTWNFLSGPGDAQYQLGSAPGTWLTIPGLTEAQLTNPALATSVITSGDTVAFYGAAVFTMGNLQLALGPQQGGLSHMTHDGTSYTADPAAGDYVAAELSVTPP